MKYSNFVHLHTHSQYSLLDGACRLDSVIQMAKAFKMPALAITDHGNMFGAIEFYKKAIKEGIKPIIGCEAYIAGNSRFDKKPSQEHPNGGYHLVLLAKNEIGYRNLIKLTSSAFLEGFYHRPRIDKELLRQHSEGLIATSACLKGEVNWLLKKGEVDKAVTTAREYEDIFGRGNFYLEIQNHGLDFEIQNIPKVTAIAKETGIPLVATNDCHYLNKEEAHAHELLLCIQTGKTINDPKRFRFSTDEFYFKSPETMKKSFSHCPESIATTQEIADRCNLEINFGDYYFPNFPVPEGQSLDSMFKTACWDGLKARFNDMRQAGAFNAEVEKIYTLVVDEGGQAATLEQGDQVLGRYSWRAPEPI